MELPTWLSRLDDNDLHFVKRMVLVSGSLKQLAAEYEVSYPTIRQRLDRIIERIKVADDNPGDDAFESRIRVMVSENQIEPTLAKELMDLHRQAKQEGANDE